MSRKIPGTYAMNTPATYISYSVRLFALFGPTVDGLEKQKYKKL